MPKKPPDLDTLRRARADAASAWRKLEDVDDPEIAGVRGHLTTALDKLAQVERRLAPDYHGAPGREGGGRMENPTGDTWELPADAPEPEPRPAPRKRGSWDEPALPPLPPRKPRGSWD